MGGWEEGFELGDTLFCTCSCGDQLLSPPPNFYNCLCLLASVVKATHKLKLNNHPQKLERSIQEVVYEVLDEELSTLIYLLDDMKGSVNEL